jgi:hypothetical protein
MGRDEQPGPTRRVKILSRLGDELGETTLFVPPISGISLINRAFAIERLLTTFGPPVAPFRTRS